MTFFCHHTNKVARNGGHALIEPAANKKANKMVRPFNQLYCIITGLFFV